MAAFHHSRTGREGWEWVWRDDHPEKTQLYQRNHAALQRWLDTGQFNALGFFRDIVRFMSDETEDTGLDWTLSTIGYTCDELRMIKADKGDARTVAMEILARGWKANPSMAPFSPPPDEQ